MNPNNDETTGKFYIEMIFDWKIFEERNNTIFQETRIILSNSDISKNKKRERNLEEGNDLENNSDYLDLIFVSRKFLLIRLDTL